MEILKIGDVAVLRSGGPEMTIESIEGFSGQNDETKKTVKCVWYDGDTFKRDSFVYLSLDKIAIEENHLEAHVQTLNKNVALSS